MAFCARSCGDSSSRWGFGGFGCHPRQPRLLLKLSPLLGEGCEKGIKSLEV